MQKYTGRLHEENEDKLGCDHGVLSFCPIVFRLIVRCAVLRCAAQDEKVANKSVFVLHFVEKRYHPANTPYAVTKSVSVWLYNANSI